MVFIGMNECGYCGRNNSDEVTNCSDCGSQLYLKGDWTSPVQKSSLRGLRTFILLILLPIALLTLLLFLHYTRRLEGFSSGTNSTPVITEKHIMVFISNAPPQDYTPELLNQILRQKLGDEEIQQVINPLEITLEMSAWARQLTGGARDDLRRASRIYKALSGKLK